MIVSELIEKLCKLPHDAEVVVVVAPADCWPDNIREPFDDVDAGLSPDGKSVCL